jgi:hypothetical protein
MFSIANTGAGFAGSEDNYFSFGLELLTSNGKAILEG